MEPLLLFFLLFPSDDLFSKSDVYLPVYVWLCVCVFQARSPGAKG